MKNIYDWVRSSRRVSELMIIIVLLGLLSALGYSCNTSSAEKVPRLTNFTEAKLKAFIKDKSGLDVKDIKVNGPDGSVAIAYLDDTIWDEDDAVLSIAKYSERVMPLLFEFADVKEVKVTELGTFIDEQDNRSIEPSAAITISKTVADRINWDTINSTNKVGLIYVASDVYIHPAIRAEISYGD